MLIETDGFMVFKETETTYGYEQINIEAKVQHKQGYQKHFKRRVRNRKAKRRNRRLWIDVDGQSRWDFHQSQSWYDRMITDWEETKRYWQRNLAGYDLKVIEAKLKRIDIQIARYLDEKLEDHKPHPSEEEMVHRYRRYQDDNPPCDRSGREDRREYIKADLAKQEIRDYLVDLGPTRDDYSPPLNEADDEELMDNSFKRHLSPAEYSMLEADYDRRYEEQYWEDVRNGLFDFDCGHCGRPDWDCRCHEQCGGCGKSLRNCACDEIELDYRYDQLEAITICHNCEHCCICDAKDNLHLLEGYCHACHSFTCQCLPIVDCDITPPVRSGLGDE